MLRLTTGYAFLHAGVVEVVEIGWSAQGYLANVAASNGDPLQGTFARLAATPWFVDFVNVAVPRGELLVDLGIPFGALTRLASFFGALMMALSCFGNWDVAHRYVNGDLTCVVVFLAVAALGGGRIPGTDALLERLDLGRKTLVEWYPVLVYVPG